MTQTVSRWESYKKKIHEVLTSPWRLFKALCFWVGFIVLSGGLVVSFYLFLSLQDVPNFSKTKMKDLQKIAQKRIYKKMEVKKNHEWTPMREVSRDCLYAIVLSEDGLFFDHKGLDFDAIMNSFARNLKRGKYSSGASTISQQVVKNLFLSNEKSLIRKFKEALITLEMERGLKKNEILEIYFNMAEFGPDIYGIKAAANYYFKKEPSEINAAEGAFLAILLPSPRKYHYSVFLNKNLTDKKRRHIRRILTDMYRLEYLSDSLYRKYLNYSYF